MEPSWKTTTRTVILSIILGGGAGVLWAALTTQYLSNYALELGELTAPLRLAEERPRAFPQSYEDAVIEASEKLSPGLVSFFDATAEDEGTYLAREAVLHGAVLTSDGWILTVPEEGMLIAGFTVLVGRTAYAVDQVVPDPATGAVLVKVPAENLPVLSFGKGKDVIPGEHVFVVPGEGGLIGTSVVGEDWGVDALWSSDQPRRRIELAQPTLLTTGAPIANSLGEFIGLVSQNTDGVRYIPLESLLPAFTSQLREGEIRRSSLGVSTIDLTRALFADEEVSRGLNAGALVPTSSAIVRGGAAQTAGIKAGDIILSLNGQLVNGKHTLDELVSETKPGDVVKLLIDREGEHIEVEVTLGVL